MALPPLLARPVLAAAASLLICAVFATLAARREDVSTAVRSLWWAVAALWLVVGAHYARKAARGRGRHVAPPAGTKATDATDATHATDEPAPATSPPDESAVPRRDDLP